MRNQLHVGRYVITANSWVMRFHGCRIMCDLFRECYGMLFIAGGQPGTWHKGYKSLRGFTRGCSRSGIEISETAAQANRFPNRGLRRRVDIRQSAVGCSAPELVEPLSLCARLAPW